MSEEAEVFKLDINEDGKQILVFRGVSHADFVRVFEAMQEWRKTDQSIFCIRLNADQSLELIKVESND